MGAATKFNVFISFKKQLIDVYRGTFMKLFSATFCTRLLLASKIRAKKLNRKLLVLHLREQIY